MVVVQINEKLSQSVNPSHLGFCEGKLILLARCRRTVRLIARVESAHETRRTKGTHHGTSLSHAI